MIGKQFIKYLCLLAVIIVGQSLTTLYAQLSESDIKLTGNYEWGEAFSPEREVAITLARQDLVEGISVLVTSNVRLQTQESEDNVSSEFQSDVSAESRMRLLGLDYLDKRRRDGSWRVIAYISNDDLERSIEMERRRLSGKLMEAFRADLQGEKNKAFRLYAETYIESQNIPPEPVYVDSTLFDSDVNIRQFTREKIIDWFDKIELAATGVESSSTDENVELYIQLNAKIDNQPVSNLLVSLDTRGYGQRVIRNGSVEIFYDRKPERSTEEIDFRLKINPTILPQYLRGLSDDLIPERVSSVPVDFHDVIEIDFSTHQLSDGSYRFSPNIKNISVYDIEWVFGNGDYSNQPQPRHKFESNSPGEVTMTINQSKELSVTKIPGATTIGVNSQNSSLTARPVVFESEFVPFQHRDYIERIRRMPDMASLQGYLNLMQDNDVLRWGGVIRGQVEGVSSEDQSYIVIFDPEDAKVEDILSPVRSTVRHVITEDNISVLRGSEWQKKYKGKLPIWVEFQ